MICSLELDGISYESNFSNNFCIICHLKSHIGYQYEIWLNPIFGEITNYLNDLELTLQYNTSRVLRLYPMFDSVEL